MYCKETRRGDKRVNGINMNRKRRPITKLPNTQMSFFLDRMASVRFEVKTVLYKLLYDIVFASYFTPFDVFCIYKIIAFLPGKGNSFDSLYKFVCLATKLFISF